MKLIDEQCKNKLKECLTGWREGKLTLYNIASYAGCRWNTAKKYLEILDKEKENINMTETTESQTENNEPVDLQPKTRTPAQIPGFLLQAKDYIKQHPEAIRQVAGEEINKLENYLDTLPLGIGEIGKAKLNEFLGGAGKQPDNQEGGKFEASGETTGLQETDEHISKDTWAEILEFMVELDEQGFTPGRIAEDVRHDYGLVLHPIKIKSLLENYYTKVNIQPDPEIIEAEIKDIQPEIDEQQIKERKATLSIIKKLQTENLRYKAEEQKTAAIHQELKIKRDIMAVVDERLNKNKPEIKPQLGVLRRFLKWAV